MNTNRRMMARPFSCLLAVVMAGAAALFPVRAASAAVIDTTGGITVLNFDNPANTYIGNGVLQVSDDGSGSIELATNSGVGQTVFEMTGGSIIIDSGVTLRNGGWQRGVWTNNLASLNVSGTFDIWDGQPVRVDEFNGDGTVTKGHSGQSPTVLNIGVNNGSGTFSGVIQNPQGTLALTKHGSGTQVLTGQNTYTGTTTISAGTLQIGDGGTTGTLGSGGVTNNGTLVFNRSNNVTVANAITGTGSVVKEGPNELILSGNNDYSGGTTVTGGLLRATDNTIGSGDLTLQGGGIFFNVSGVGGGVTSDNNFQNAVDLGTGGGGFRAGWGAMTLSGQIGGVGSFTIVNDNAVTLTNTGNGYEGNTIIGASGSGNNATLRLGASEVIPHGAGKGNLVFNPSSGGTATLDLNGQPETVNALVSGGAGTSRVIGSGTLNVGANDADGTFAGVLSGGMSLVKIGGGTQVLAGANTYTGATTISAGTLKLEGGDDRLPAGTNVALADTAGTTLDLGGTNQTIRWLTGGGAGGGSVVNTGGTNSTLTLNLLDSGSRTFAGTIDGDIRVVIQDSSNKNTHVQTFSGSNTYTGGTVIDDGHLRITNDAGLGAVPAAFDSQNVTLLNGGVLQNNDSDPVLNANRGVYLAGPAQIYVGWSKSFTIPGVISGPGSLTKPDSGRLTLTGTANTYEGGTTVTGGYLQLSGDGGLGAVPAAPTVNLTLDGGGIKNNNSTNVLHANRTILLGGSGGWFTSGWGKATTIHGQITGPGAFTVNNDSGPIIPTNPANDYAGNTTIGGTFPGASGNNATLRLGASEVIPHGAGKGNLVFNPSSGGTATLDLNGQTETVNALVSGGAGTRRITGGGTLTFGGADAGGSFTGHITSSPNINLVKIGSGTQTLAGTLIDHFGSTTVSGGTLRFLELDDLHSSQLVIATGAIAEFSNSARTFNRFSATSIEGEGTFVKTGTGLLRTGNATNQFAHWNMTGGLIDVREGEFRADYQNNSPVTGAWANNKASLNVEAGAFVSMVGGNHISVDAVSGTGTIQNINNWGVGVLTVGSNDGSGTFGGTMRNSGGVMALTKIGAGTQTLTGANTYTGPTTISGGTLMVDGTHIGGGLYTVRDGGTLGGTGIVGATVGIDAGGTHAPGASVGEQTLGDAVWNPGGAFEFEVNDALGTAGGPAGWDLATISTDYGAGTLDISNLTAGSFQIDILSLSDLTSGPIANFNPTVPNTWEFVTYDSLLGEFDPDLFVLDDTDFRAHNTMGKGHFTILQTDAGLAIGFIPEPSTLMMGLIALIIGLGWRRRR